VTSSPAPERAPQTGEATASAPASESFEALDALLDVSMPVIIEIGRTSMSLSEILQLRPGSVVQLDRMVGDTVDIHVSDRKLAEGEVVVVGDHFGVRVTRVIAHAPGGERA
jgi:flagellar motor switch protein FliN/FliY